MDCIFCKIAEGKIPGQILYQDNGIVAFPDINPVAPVHILVIPKKHIPALTDVTKAYLSLIGKMVSVANQLAREKGISESGYRLVINNGKDAGQLVPHLHIHLIGGRKLVWAN